MELLKLLELIKNKRKEKGLSQTDIANKLGITQGAYSALEIGRAELSVTQFFRVCEILEIDFTPPPANNVLVAVTEQTLTDNTTNIVSLQNEVGELKNDMGIIKNKLDIILEFINKK